MGEQHLNITVTASFHQRFALVVIASICLCSLLVWPPLDSTFLQLAYAVTFFVFILFFSYQLWRLNHWQCQFVLNVDGSGRLIDGQIFSLSSRRWVTPLACAFYLEVDTEEGEGTKQAIIIWADMLAIEQYRHLCRILVNSSPSV